MRNNAGPGGAQHLHLVEKAAWWRRQKHPLPAANNSPLVQHSENWLPSRGSRGSRGSHRKWKMEYGPSCLVHVTCRLGVTRSVYSRIRTRISCGRVIRVVPVVVARGDGCRVGVGIPQACTTASRASCSSRRSLVLASRRWHSLRCDAGKRRMGATIEVARSNACGCCGLMSQTRDRVRRPGATWDNRRAEDCHLVRSAWATASAPSPSPSPAEAGL
jgi:hypothetical protein